MGYNNIYGGGGSLHSNSTPSSFAALAAAAMAARLLPLQLSLSLHSYVLTLCTLYNSLSKHASFIGNSWQLSPAIARGQ